MLGRGPPSPGADGCRAEPAGGLELIVACAFATSGRGRGLHWRWL